MSATSSSHVIISTFSDIIEEILQSSLKKSDKLIPLSFEKQILEDIMYCFDISDKYTLESLIKVFNYFAMNKTVEIIAEVYLNKNGIDITNRNYRSLDNQARLAAVKILEDEQIVTVHKSKVYPGKFIEECLICIDIVDYCINNIKSKSLQHPLESNIFEKDFNEKFHYWVLRGLNHFYSNHYWESIN